MAKKAEKEAPETEATDGPILDLTDAEVKKADQDREGARLCHL
ncbi:MAG: hypothetical protein R3C40_10920 [Parvularculaceae bacterium]